MGGVDADRQDHWAVLGMAAHGRESGTQVADGQAVDILVSSVLRKADATSTAGYVSTLVRRVGDGEADPWVAEHVAMLLNVSRYVDENVLAVGVDPCHRGLRWAPVTAVSVTTSHSSDLTGRPIR